MFNVVTKKPEKDPYSSIQQQVGSDNFLQTNVDTTGAFNQDQSLLYRVIGSYEDTDSFRDRIETTRTFLAPSFSFIPNASTRINLELETARHESPIDRGIPAVGDRPADVSRSTNYNEPDAHHVNRSDLIALDWTHQLNNTWSVRQNLMLEQGRGHGLEYQQARAVDFGIDDPTLLLRLPRSIERRDVDTEYTSLELAGAPEWAGMQHDFIVGVDTARLRQHFDFREPLIDGAPNIEILPIFDFSPTGLAPTPSDPSLLRKTEANSWGLYAQDQIQITEQVNLLLGARYDDAQEKAHDLLNDQRTDVNDEKFSPRLGLVYSLTSHTSLFGSYTESFSQANTDVSANGTAMDPISAEQYEVGFKGESGDKRVFTTLALYDLTKKNIVVPDPENLGFNVQIGEANSRGVEWDLGGRVTPHWNLTASYSYTEAEVTRDTVETNEGRNLYGVPKHAAKLFTRFDDQAGGATGWSVAGGFVALDKQAGDIENTFEIPGYVRFDSMAAYKWLAGDTRLTLQLNVENLGDKTYHLPTGGAGEIAFGKPRTTIASLRAEF